ncbi:MAG: hypothetical protein WCD70_03860 [Alphaproteobacteria bacterium]
MSAVNLNLKGLVAICASALLLSVSPVHAQGAQPVHMPTIADCPPGYVLAVQDTDAPMPLASDDTAQSDQNTDTVDGQMAAFKTRQQQQSAYAADQAQAPRAFVTGCVLPQPAQQQEQQQR